MSDGDYVFEAPNPNEEAGIRQHQINVYADVLIRVYGFTGEDAEHERNYVVASLTAYESIDYDALGQRAQRNIVQNDIRDALRSTATATPRSTSSSATTRGPRPGHLTAALTGCRAAS